MTSKQYVKDFCNGDWNDFFAKVKSGTIREVAFRWLAYEALTTYEDEHGTTIEHLVYLGGD